MIARILLDGLLRAFTGRRADPAPPPTAPEAAIPIRPPAGYERIRIAGVNLAALREPHGAFDSTARWRLIPSGLAVDGVVRGSGGEPVTARQAVEFFGQEFRIAAREFGVPVELLIACACAEAGVHIRQGYEAARTSERREPGFVSYASTPHRVSVGVMHTLLSTARTALSDPTIMAIDLCTPLTSVRAGAAYIASQKPRTGYDPPLVAAGYNSGGVYDDPTPGLPFSLRDFPAGEDRHVTRFCAFFNDAWGLVKADPSIVLGAPSFVREVSE